MKELKIKITGSGDKWMIAQMLDEVAHLVGQTSSHTLEAGVKWEDGVLMTEISENEDVDEPEVIHANDYFGVQKVTREDIIMVAGRIKQTLTDVEIEWVNLCYEDAQRQDPTGSWDLVVEDLIYQIPRIREQ